MQQCYLTSNKNELEIDYIHASVFPLSLICILKCFKHTAKIKLSLVQNVSLCAKKKKCWTCVVVAKRGVTNNIYMGEVCISAVSQSTACLSLYQSKDNEGSPHCNYRQCICQSLLINMNKEGRIKVFGLNLPRFLTWEGENGPASYSSYQNLLRERVFKAFVCQSFPVMDGWVRHVEGVQAQRLM